MTHSRRAMNHYQVTEQVRERVRDILGSLGASDDEQLLLIKTRVELLTPLKAAIESSHSYDCPELIVLEIADGSTPYLAWLAQSLPEPAAGD